MNLVFTDLLFNVLQIFLINSEPFDNLAANPFTLTPHFKVVFKYQMNVDQFHFMFNAGL